MKPDRIACQYPIGLQGVKMLNKLNLSWTRYQDNYSIEYRTVHLYKIQKTPVGSYLLFFRGDRIGVYNRLFKAKKAAKNHFNAL